MIQVANEEKNKLRGKRPLADLVKGLDQLGLQAEYAPLDFGDIAFTGNGPDGRPVLVGLEIKTVSDVLSCIRDGRFAGHQLPGLNDTYESWWLVIEGETKPGYEDVRPGIRQLLMRTFTMWNPPSHMDTVGYWDYHHWLHTLIYRAGGKVWVVRDRAELIQWVGGLYTWWTDPKGWEGHNSCVALHEGMDDDLRQNQVALISPTFKMKIAGKLPGLGVKKAFLAAQHFPTIRGMINAGEKEWMKVAGVGKEIARQIVKVVTEETRW